MRTQFCSLYAVHQPLWQGLLPTWVRKDLSAEAGIIVYTGAGITPICGATTPSASLSRGTSRCHKAQGKVYSMAEPCLADQIPPTLPKNGDPFGCPFHADHPQDIFLSHGRSPHPQRPPELSSSGQKLHGDSLHLFAQADVSPEQLSCFPGGMLQDHFTSIVQGTAGRSCPFSACGPSPSSPPALLVLTFKAFFAASAPARLSKVTKPTGYEKQHQFQFGRFLQLLRLPCYPLCPRQPAEEPILSCTEASSRAWPKIPALHLLPPQMVWHS